MNLFLPPANTVSTLAVRRLMGRLMVINTTVITARIAKFQVIALALLIPETGQGYGCQPDSRWAGINTT
jgi:hypothetical protein